MEIEIKLGPSTPEVALSVLNDTNMLPPAGEEQVVVMKTIYYDDLAGNFAARKQTLRLRKENELSVCCFKSALQGLSRTEVECEAADIQSGARLLSQHPDVPADVARALAEGVFVPVCEAAYTRRTRLCVREGTVFHLCFDHGYLKRGDAAEPLCEIELELVEGSSDVLQTLAEQITGAYGLNICTLSKQQRAMSIGNAKDTSI